MIRQNKKTVIAGNPLSIFSIGISFRIAVVKLRNTTIRHVQLYCSAYGISSAALYVAEMKGDVDHGTLNL
ncbi:MAG TPA: hypothetical protein VN260_05335 [Dissulfurispiraceae bacterium]|nr:hypothetical protein [Dissulfurispiraceae bacterium]